MLRDPAASGFHVHRQEDGVLIVAQPGALLEPSVRRRAQVLVVVGLVGLAAMAALRAPLSLHAVFMLLFALAVLAIAQETQVAGSRVSGTLFVEPERRRITRRRGLSMLRWQELALPANGVFVLDTLPDFHAKRLFPGFGRPCRLSVVDLPDLAEAVDAAWTTISRREPFTGTALAEGVSYDTARGLAEGLARTFGWEVFDLAVLEAERRDPSRLDVPLHQRIDSLLAGLPHASPSRRPWGAIAWQDSEGTHLAMRSIGLGGLLVQATLAVPFLAGLFLLSGGNWGLPLVGLTLLVFGAGERTTIDLGRERVVIRRVTVWLPIGAEDVLWWDEIEQVQALSGRTTRGIRFVRDRGSAFVPTSSRQAARWAVDVVRRHLVDAARTLIEDSPQALRPSIDQPRRNV